MELIPVDHDPFGVTDAGDGKGVTVTPMGARGPQLVPVDHDPFAKGYAEDMAKSLGSGVVRGTAQLAGMGGDINKGLETAITALEQSGFSIDREAMLASMPGWLRKYHQTPGPKIGSSEIMGAIDSATGLPITSYKSQTTPGKYAGSVGEMVPTSLLGPGGRVRNLVNFAAVPGVVSEGAGQLPGVAGTSLETPFRVGGAVISGGVAGAVNRPASAERAIRGAMRPGVDQAAINQAAALMDDAAQRGVNLTWAEALEQAAPGAGLTNLQRVLESTAGGREVLSPFFAQRPGQIEAAGRQAFDTIAPVNNAPSGIGRQIGTAAEDTVNDTRRAINNASDPLYAAAENVRLSPQQMAKARALPGFEAARAAVRDNPQLNRYVSHLPDDSVGFLNEVKKQLDNMADNASSPVNQQRNTQVAAGFTQDATTARGIGVAASPVYEQALNLQQTARERYLQPLLDGPLGKFATKDAGTKQAIDALFPRNPLPNSAEEITTAVTALGRRNPAATRDLVRAHAEMTFNEAARLLQTGHNQFVGAKFAKDIIGNPQQRQNLQAAVEAMGPDGRRVWQGFEQFLEIAQATGTRQAVGSKTAFNTMDLENLATGSAVGNVIKTGASPSKWLTKASDVWSQWQLGNNTERLAQILVDPQSRRMFVGIAGRPVGDQAALMMAARLTMIAKQASDQATQGR